MVKHALLVLVALGASPVHAERPPVPPEPSTPTYTRLGTRISYATITLDHVPMASYAAGVSLDRVLVGDLRLVGEYDFMWLGPIDDIDVGVAGLPASGHRLQAVARYQLVRGALGGSSTGVRGQGFVDVDVGGGASIIDDPMRGVSAPVQAFVGLHMGYSLLSADRRALWEYDILFRMTNAVDGIGVMFGLGLTWGD